MNKSKALTAMWLAALTTLMACSNGNGKMLEGRIVGMDSIPDDAALGYCPDGNLYNNQLTELTINPDGTFALDVDLADDEADVTIEISGIGFFGAHLTKGGSVAMTIERGDEGQWAATFEGAAADVNRYVCAFTQAFDMMRYWSPDPAEAKSNDEYRQLLDSEYQRVVALLPEIADEQQRDHYRKLTESQYKWGKIRLIMDRYQDADGDYRTDAEYQELVAGIDINDPINLRTNMAYTSLASMATAKMEGDNGAYCTELMHLCDSLVTNPALRTFMVQMIGQLYYAYGDGCSDYRSFSDRFVAWAGADSVAANEMVKQFEEKLQACENTKVGAAVPDAELTTPTGEKVMLSSLIGNGRFTYIDVWATWCGPCCKEIPHLEKLVEKYAAQADKVQFISISIDENVEAWQKKIDKDKPQWPQYIINGEAGQQFSADWGISGIPRFIMIGKDGCVFNGNSSRPSEPETVEIIDQQIGQ